VLEVRFGGGRKEHDMKSILNIENTYNKLKKIAFTILGIGICMMAKAQEKDAINLRGIIYCHDTLQGVISNVEVINTTRKWGTVSNDKGEFEIRVYESDTIIFSTIQHYDIYYYQSQNESPLDTLEIVMYQDTIWLNVVTILGQKSLDDFNREFLALDLPDHDISLRLPLIDKYAYQKRSELGVVEIRGPLTYLSKKIQKLARRKKGIRYPLDNK
jgi:hypothetical protein